MGERLSGTARRWRVLELGDDDMRIGLATGLAMLAAVAIVRPVAGEAATVYCAVGCYGVLATARAASNSDFYESFSVDGPTSASAAASSVVPGEEVYSGPNSGRASASIANGAVRAYVNAFGGGAEVNANWFDRVSFTLAPGVTSVDVPVMWRVEGSNGIQSFGQQDSFTSEQSINARFLISAAQGGHDAIDFRVDGCSTSPLCAIGPVSEVFSDTMTIEADVLYTFEMGIYLYGSNMVSDFSNTAFVRFDLPDGVVLNSSSGTFLSDPIAITAVPEPASWLTMILGFGVAGAALRRRRLAAVPA